MLGVPYNEVPKGEGKKPMFLVVLFMGETDSTSATSQIWNSSPFSMVQHPVAEREYVSLEIMQYFYF